MWACPTVRLLQGALRSRAPLRSAPSLPHPSRGSVLVLKMFFHSSFPCKRESHRITLYIDITNVGDLNFDMPCGTCRRAKISLVAQEAHAMRLAAFLRQVETTAIV